MFDGIAAVYGNGEVTQLTIVAWSLHSAFDLSFRNIASDLDLQLKRLSYVATLEFYNTSITAITPDLFPGDFVVHNGIEFRLTTLINISLPSVMTFGIINIFENPLLENVFLPYYEEDRPWGPTGPSLNIGENWYGLIVTIMSHELQDATISGCSNFSAPALLFSGSLTFENNSLRTLELPKWEHTESSSGITIESNPLLAGVFLPRLLSLGFLEAKNNPLLEEISIPLLETVVQRLDVIGGHFSR